RIDAHHRRGEIGIELAVDRGAESRRYAAGGDLDHGAGGGPSLAHAIEMSLPGRDDSRVRGPEGVLLHGRPVPLRTVGGVRAHLHGGAADGPGRAEHVLQPLARDRTGGDAARGLARRRTAAAAIVADAVFRPVGVVGVAGPELVLDGSVILGALVFVL